MQALGSDLKKVINLPFYMNAWMGESPSTYTYMDVLHAAAPVLDAMGPDAYGNFATWETDVGLSLRSWNALMIPEQNHAAEALWRAVGNYNEAISGEWYTVEGFDWLDCRETYDLFERMAPLIASKRGSGDMMGFFQSTHAAGESWSEYFQDLKITYTAEVRPHLLKVKPKVPTTQETISNVRLGELDGCGLLISLGDGEYVLTSTRMDVALSYINGGPISVSDVEAGHFVDGVWVSDGPGSAEREDGVVRFHFPSENRQYGQIRFKLTSAARNPARVFEAEHGRLLAQAEPAYDSRASGAFCVSNISGEGAGVEIPTNLAWAAEGLSIRYSSKRPAKATVFVDGKASQDVDFPATYVDSPRTGGTGSNSVWEEKSLAVHVPAGATVSIEADQREPGPDVDCIILSRDAKPAVAPSTAP